MIKSLSNAAPSTRWELMRHYGETYFSLRLGLMLLAFAFPVALYGVGRFVGLDLQPSMSAYYFAAVRDHCALFPARTLFVGFLCAIGAGLYFYKGFTKLENVLLNLAGACAVVVAFVPERMGEKEAAGDRLRAVFEACPAVKAWAEAGWSEPRGPFGVHYTAAVLLFVFLALVAWKCACKTLDHLPAGTSPRPFKLAYKAVAIAMLACPAAGFVIAYVVRGSPDEAIFFVEAAGIWVFATYWLVKSYELSLSGLEREVGAAGPPPGALPSPSALPAAPA